MKIKILLYLSLLFLTTPTLFSQEKQLEKGNQKFSELSYIDAISVYERVANKGYKSAELFQKLGDSYYFNAEFTKASKWYAELFLLDNSTIASEYYYRYAQTLKSLGQYEKANELLDKFNVISKEDIRGALFTKKKDYLEVIKSNSGRYTIEDAGINSEYSDFAASYFDNALVFASTRDTSGFFKRKHTWTNEAFSDLYISEILPNGTLNVPVKFSKNINSKFNESTPVFTKDGVTVYFTRNNFKDGKRGKDADKATLLKIYKATLKDNNWEDIVELPFNNNEYNVAHPALSPDEKTLYFASDMPGTLGQSDLFKVAINSDGSFGTPENLGSEINTEGKETFPFVSAENELYFASDGHPGLGGLDIFVSKLDKEEKRIQPVNIGEPVNSATDDFAFIINTTNKIGFFSSYRPDGKGFDDIYKFKEEKVLVCNQVLSGTIVDAETGAVLPNVEVILLDENFQEVQKVISDEKGFYTFDVECGKIYYVRANKPDLVTNEIKAIIDEVSGETALNVTLQKAVVPFQIGEDIGKKLNIKKIYFDLGKANIRPDAEIELAKVLEVMLEYPTLKIDVRSHTDSRDSHKNNEKLSDRRAKSTVAWFIQKGIDAERVSGKGYGETQLINKCADGVKCSEEEHQFNRRSEFIVLAL
ncbi:OmpA family protein [Flavobacterium soli]|uniref:OmpA family protein n=1 Tax=Flavobacterium soli TaxID=344881 RepID=UPI0003FB5912|nr:OmpA family protein [Flavobacterium soli]